MKSIAAIIVLVIIGYNVVSIFNTGKEFKETAAVVQEMQKDRREAKKLRPVMRACKSEMFSHCADYNTAPQIVECLDQLEEVSENCADKLDSLKG